MSNLWSQLVRELEPYVPGEQPRDREFVKLNTNENPYPPSPEVAKQIQAFATDSLRRYPDPNSQALKDCLAITFALQNDQVFVGNGSDEVLAFAFMAFFKQSKSLLFPDITYSFYTVYCDLFEISYQQIPLGDEFNIDVSAYNQPNGGVILANPNAPTGIALALAAIETLLQANSESVVLIDEAYVDFGADSAVQLINRYPTLLVVQTLSKSRSLAGIRLGYALGNPELIAALERVKNSFNCYPIDSIANVSAIAALDDQPYFETTCQKIIADRDWFTSELQAEGFSVLPSKANFVFATHPELEAKQLYESLKKKGVLVRYFSKPRINQFLRITIGTRDELEALLAALP